MEEDNVIIKGNFITEFLDRIEMAKEQSGILPVGEFADEFQGYYTFKIEDNKYLEDIEKEGFWFKTLREPTYNQNGLLVIYSEFQTMPSIFCMEYASPETYVSRVGSDQIIYDTLLSRLIEISGKHVVIHGLSKLGKTSLWRKVINDRALNINCNPRMTIEDLYSNILYSLKEAIITQTKKEKYQEKKVTININVNFGKKDTAQAGMGIGNTSTLSEREEETRELRDISLSTNIVIPALRENNHVLVLENFHRLPKKTIEHLSFDLRDFSDNRISVVLVGIPSNPMILNDFNSELDARIMYLEFLPWSIDELRSIAIGGEEVLNIKFSHSTLDFLALEAAGSPLLMQEFCYIACLDAGIKKSVEYVDTIEINKDRFKAAMHTYMLKFLMPTKNRIENMIEVKQSLDKESQKIISNICNIIRSSNPKLTIEFKELQGRGNDKLFIESFNKFKSDCRISQILAIDLKKRRINICDPLIIPYLRWVDTDIN